jgi:hypothetical protein
MGHEDGADASVLDDALDVVGCDDGLAGSCGESNELSLGALEPALLESFEGLDLIVSGLDHDVSYGVF